MNGLHLLAVDIFDQVMNNPDTLGERFASGMQTLGLGMGIVFAVLIIIWGACELLHTAVHGTGKAQTPTASAPASETVTPTPTVAPAPTQTENSELIAVITAAVAAMLDQPTTAFRVVSFRRTGEKGHAWNANQAE